MLLKIARMCTQCGESSCGHRILSKDIVQCTYYDIVIVMCSENGIALAFN